MLERPELLLAVTGKGYEKQVVVAVAGGIEKSMRVASKGGEQQESLVVASLGAELEHCAKIYCGARNTSSEVFEEATDFVLSRFGHLGLLEVREAFRLAAAGELPGLDTDSIRAYYGEFTIIALGSILRGYDQYRAEIVKEIRRREIEALALEEKDGRATSWNTSAWEAERIRKLLNMDFPRGDGMEDSDEVFLSELAVVEYVTAYDYEFLSRRGDLSATKEEKAAAWADAAVIVTNDYEKLGHSNQSFRRALQNVRSGIKDEGFEARRIATAKRLLVVRWVTARRAEMNTIQSHSK